MRAVGRVGMAFYVALLVMTFGLTSAAASTGDTITSMTISPSCSGGSFGAETSWRGGPVSFAVFHLWKQASTGWVDTGISQGGTRTTRTSAQTTFSGLTAGTTYSFSVDLIYNSGTGAVQTVGGGDAFQSPWFQSTTC